MPKQKGGRKQKFHKKYKIGRLAGSVIFSSKAPDYYKSIVGNDNWLCLYQGQTMAILSNVV